MAFGQRRPYSVFLEANKTDGGDAVQKRLTPVKQPALRKERVKLVRKKVSVYVPYRQTFRKLAPAQAGHHK